MLRVSINFFTCGVRYVEFDVIFNSSVFLCL